MTTSAQEENFVEKVKEELLEIDQIPVSQHADRFEQLHQKLDTALSTIDGL
ncbi:unannotated protein [freshwater metagenome]|uniref:Unannotated protein n=1 Tax=freshwater metagenome TaxID=449393 RepID=A0A6J7K2D7_9ZZZZ|nr:hypothetical protein [Actinomycetota bacterium]